MTLISINYEDIENYFLFILFDHTNINSLILRHSGICTHLIKYLYLNIEKKIKNIIYFFFPLESYFLESSFIKSYYL